MGCLIERHDKDIVGVVSCFDRVIIHGTLPGFGYSDGMTSYLTAQGIRVFDYTKFAEPLRDQIRSNAEALAEQSGIEIQFLRTSNIRKESVVQKIVAERGSKPGLVCILSAMETCQTAISLQRSAFSRRMPTPDTRQLPRGGMRLLASGMNPKGRG
jgi:hypothetical protein